MNPVLDILVAVAILSALAMLGTRRLQACAIWVGFQGVAIGAMPILLAQEPFDLRFGVLVSGQLLLKGLVFPWLLLRQCRKVDVTQHPGSAVGFPGAVLLGLAALGLSGWLALRIGGSASSIPFATSFFLILAGLILTVVRQKALMQVIGYLTLENGIYVFGSVAVIGTPLLVELGVLLDVFVAVFVMGLAIDYIHLQFASTDVGSLSNLKG